MRMANLLFGAGIGSPRHDESVADSPNVKLASAGTPLFLSLASTASLPAVKVPLQIDQLLPLQMTSNGVSCGSVRRPSDLLEEGRGSIVKRLTVRRFDANCWCETIVLHTARKVSGLVETHARLAQIAADVDESRDPRGRQAEMRCKCGDLTTA